MITKRIKAPDWFRAIWENEVVKSRRFSAALLGYDVGWLKAAKPQAIQEIFNTKLNREQKARYMIFVNYANHAKEYAFFRLRFEHIEDPSIRDADTINYQEDKGYIITKAGMFGHMVKKLTETAAKIFGQENVKTDQNP